MTVQLAMRKNDDRITAKAIQWWTNSIYSHCELVVDDLCYSSSPLDGGVRAKTISMTADKWDFVSVPWADAGAVLDYFKATDHHEYGWSGLIFNQLLNLNRSDGKSQFCSQWCAAALGLPSAASYSPATLADLCSFIAGKASVSAPPSPAVGPATVNKIQEQVRAMIADQYSVHDEIKLLRTAPSPEFELYNEYAEHCRQWGRAQRALLGVEQ